VRVKIGDVLAVLSKGLPVFQFRAAQSITGSGLLILGAVSPRAVEAFGSADRIMRNSVGLLGPISAAGMPRIARLIGTDVSAARRTARLSFQVMLGLGLLGGSLLLAFAPFVVNLLLGQDYEFVVPILRIVALALPLSAASGMLGVQWMLPLGLDKPLVRITLAAGLLNVAGFAVLGSRYGALGAAVTIVVMEAVLVIGMVVAIRRAGLGSFWSDR
jgi:PST family polysaccharide transporter